MIEFKGVSKSYAGTMAIDTLDLTVARGELLVLIGASGSGKSTLLKMINRLETHDAGQLLFDGQDITSFNLQALRLRMGYAIQSVGLFPHWTVARNIAAVPQLLGWPAARVAARVDALLTMFDLPPEPYRQRFPHELSGGQQQRVGVARALAGDPDMLLMDEPFGALDPVIRSALQGELQRIHQATGKTIVMVTHDLDEALRLGTRIVLLEHGRVLQVATPLALLAEPANARVLDFLGRNDLGIKRLSLQTARSLARVQAPCGGPSLTANATLREAVSLLAQHGMAMADVNDAMGAHAGVLHAADIFQPPETVGPAC
jgi:osmoprotectant transport system ATP-binding protein